MNTNHRSSSAILAFATLLAAVPILAPMSHAANINWGTPQQISGNTDVSTNGTLVGAANAGDTGVPSTTVNGVTFQSFAAPGANGSSGIFTMTTAGSGSASNTEGGSASAPFNTLSPAYQTLLSSFVGSVFSTTLSMGGLIAGLQYEFQLWSNRSGIAFNQGVTLNAGNSVTLFSNPSSMEGGLGQYVIGTFTADAAMQSLTFSGDGEVRGIVNGFQLRQLSRPSGVPEAGSTLALLAAALGGLAGLKRTLRAQQSAL